MSSPLTPCGGSGSAGKTADLEAGLRDPERRLEGAEEKSQTPSALAFAQRIRLKRQGDRLMPKVTVDSSTCDFECRSRPCSRADIGDHIFRSDRHELKNASINAVFDKFPAQIQMLAASFEMTMLSQINCTMIVFEQ